jgi:cysteinyl-tRNA synthetase
VALAAAVLEACRAVGLELRADDEVPEDVVAEVRALDEARAAKDYGLADQIRAALQDAGWVVESHPGGSTVRRP